MKLGGVFALSTASGVCWKLKRRVNEPVSVTRAAHTRRPQGLAISRFIPDTGLYPWGPAAGGQVAWASPVQKGGLDQVPPLPVSRDALVSFLESSGT